MQPRRSKETCGARGWRKKDKKKTRKPILWSFHCMSCYTYDIFENEHCIHASYFYIYCTHAPSVGTGRVVATRRREKKGVVDGWFDTSTRASVVATARHGTTAAASVTRPSPPSTDPRHAVPTSATVRTETERTRVSCPLGVRTNIMPR